MYSLNKNQQAIEISQHADIGPGLFLNHGFGIVVNGHTKIGRNCTISTGVVLGETAKGTPIIGDDVFIMAGAKIIGNIRVGNNVMIGANCVVTKDVPDNAFVAGIPGKIIRYNKPASEEEPAIR